MEETKEQQGLHRLLQFGIYLSVAVEVGLFYYAPQLAASADPRFIWLLRLLSRLSRIPFYHELLYSKLFTLVLICLVSVGTLSRKNKDLNPRTQIIFPLSAGLLIFFSGIWFQGRTAEPLWLSASGYDLTYILSSFIGVILIHAAMDNVSKLISSNLGKDKWNVEGESFMQPLKAVENAWSVNIPMLFYYRNKVRKGWINLDNIFRGTMLIGTPGSGKSFGVVNPFIRQLIAKEFTLCVYDFKFV